MITSSRSNSARVGRVAHTVDLFVNLALFLDVGVRPRHIGLWLVIIVVGHEIFDGVVRGRTL
jgi:hypothetical protein